MRGWSGDRLPGGAATCKPRPQEFFRPCKLFADSMLIRGEGGTDSLPGKIPSRPVAGGLALDHRGWPKQFWAASRKKKYAGQGNFSRIGVFKWVANRTTHAGLHHPLRKAHKFRKPTSENSLVWGLP